MGFSCGKVLGWLSGLEMWIVWEWICVQVTPDAGRLHFGIVFVRGGS